MIRSLLALLLLAVVAISGCAHCPLRLFACQERTCIACGQRYVEYLDQSDHRCGSVAGKK